ncbi:HipA N-terminal domain-containing protein [Segetibacter aerophilus]|uniref:Phosphatidylinositol kinase n=1 Tax=Segetibacter aerophilus TaxID=670293 RepID=A0A512BJS2_9BACT|nr:HipA N-terminal domain-containing protein [Segetibacter aerophilus]GEO12220.1 phosphatidylinositol kinase [Segetibacter aerophilus]
MRRSGRVLFKNKHAGIVWQDEDGYGFRYDEEYLKLPIASPISLTLPLRQASYVSNTMLPFFDGLIPEGWLLDITVKNWKVNPNDRMELLLVACKDCIGAVGVEPIENEEE